MARSHAVTKVSITSDEDFLALTHDAKFMYWWLLSQPKLTLAGTLDLRLKAWARQSPDTTVEDIESYLDELEKAGYVIVDHDTDELMIRSFLVHDMCPARASDSTLKGLWGQWTALESRFLQAQIVAMMPDELWAKAEDHAPAEARQTRRSLPFERERAGMPVPARTGTPQESDSPFELPTTCLPPPSTASAAAANARPRSNEDAVEPPTAEPVEPALGAAARERRIGEALDILTDRQLVATPSKTNAAGHRKAIREGKRKDHHEDAHQALVADPHLSASALADVLRPPPPELPPSSGKGEVAHAYWLKEQARAEQEAQAEAERKREAADPRSLPRIQAMVGATRAGLRSNGVAS